MREILEFVPGSYRDRSSRVFSDDQGRIYRALSAASWSEWSALQSAPFFREAVQAGRVVSSEPVSNGSLHWQQLPGEWAGILRHERIPFISYPYEWTFSMLQDAALLHLELLSAALKDQFTMK